jgi:predicted aspartyl protease
LNSDGSNETRVSSSNKMDIQGITWNEIEMYETSNMNNHEDIIIGNGFFLDQIYKIDYEKSIIVLYSNKPIIDTDFVKQNMILDNGVRPVIEVKFVLDGEAYTDWFLFDTGNTGNGIISNRFLVKNNLYKKFSTFIAFRHQKVSFLPEMVVGNQTFSKGVITLEKAKKNGSNYKFGGLIGNKILHRFNVIIDNREGFIYLKPNRLI